MSELEEKLSRREKINAGEVTGSRVTQSVYAEFKEFSIQEIKKFKAMFEKYDLDKSQFIDLMELKYMMEKLEEPQTHVALKQMIKEVDEDNDGQISFREFMLIFRYAKEGTLSAPGLSTIANQVDVAKEGVGGAAKFFEAKVAQQTAGAKFEKEIREEQERKKVEAAAAAERKAAFKEKAAMFK